MKNFFCFWFLLCLGYIDADAQSVYITGERYCIVPGGEYAYAISGDWNSDDMPMFNWGVTGGTIVTGSAGTDYIRIVWNSNFVTGEVTLSTPGGFYRLDISKAPQGGITAGNLYPLQQTVYTGIAFTLSVSGTTGGTCTSANYTYQWEQSSSAGGPFTAIAGATTATMNGIPESIPKNVYYRCRIQASGIAAAYTGTALVTFIYPPLDAGSISWNNTPILWNTKPVINQIAGSGQVCVANPAAYTWEQSVNNGSTWTSIGTGISYPAAAPAITFDNTLIRRKIVCGTSSLYSNTLAIRIAALNAGTISTYNDFLPVNGRALIYQQAAGGGICNPSSYSYVWESSTNGTTWQSAGAGIDYTPVPLAGKTYIRRKVICGTSTGYSNILIFNIVDQEAYADNQNYVRTEEVWKPGIYTPAAITGLPVGDIQRTTAYFDGMGKLTQSVHQQYSGQSKDVVQLIGYDQAGRESIKYVPYTYTANDNSIGAVSGKMKVAGRSEQTTFNAAKFPGEVAYSETIYEPSPLNRVSISYPQGESWVGSNRGVTTSYLINTTSDAVRIWTINSSGVPVTNATYAAGDLFKTESRDENDLLRVDFKDKEGHDILVKRQLLPTASGGHDNWLCTYYVYNIYGDLSVVITPKAVELIKSNWQVTPAIMDGLCFSYTFDGKHRIITKKMPDAGLQEMVYDLRDRLVFTRDGNQKANGQWMGYFYDSQNRPVMTAIYTKPGLDRTALQQKMDNAANSMVALNYTVPIIDHLEIAVFDERPVYKAGSSITFNPGFESASGAVFETQLDPAANTGTITVNAALIPSDINNADLMPIAYNYFDDYNFNGARSLVPGDLTVLQNGASRFATYAEVQNTSSNMTKAQQTGKAVRILGTNRWLVTTSYFDDKGRVIQQLSDNIGGGLDIVSTRFEFGGKVLSIHQNHKNPRSGVTPAVDELDIMNYDLAGRLTEVKKILNNSAPKVIVAFTYNEFGQLAEKIQGGGINREKTEYNIRGWIKGMNRDHITGNTTDAWFGYELAYDKPGAVIPGTTYTIPQYNGNIAGMIWKGTGDSRKYDYTYDNVNRLMKATFNSRAGNTWTNTGVDYSIVMGDGINATSAYDANGNIMAMTQKGLIGGTPGIVDNMIYKYEDNSNKLRYVRDLSNNPNSVLGDFKEPAANNLANLNQNAKDYTYDVNGNLTIDENKQVTNVKYNVFNLPEEIIVAGKGTISYQYSADRIKRSKTVKDIATGRTVTTEYMGNYLYESDSLRFISNAEGRARAVYKAGLPVSYFYDYFIKDHLGSVRMVLTEQTDFTMYAATMEAPAAATETALFSNIDNTRAEKPAGYPEDATTAQNASVAKLTTTGKSKKIGPSIVLRVMAGDTIQLSAKAFYKSGSPKDQQPAASTAENMLADLVQAFNGNSSHDGAHGVASGDNMTPFNSNFYNNDYQRLKEKDADQPNAGRPKAYLNFVLFDDQFKLVDENSGVKQVKAEPDQLQTLSQDKMVMNKSGFLYVYTSNEGTQDVFFDNITLGVNSGPLLEETHYYPFGLTMAGISSNALKGTNYAENRLKYNGKELQSKEFSDGSGLEWHDYGARMYDAQIGRWHVIDPLAEMFQQHTPYNYVYNNPTGMVDLDGRKGTSTHTDSLGNVLAVFNDGDMGVYKHDDVSTAGEVRKKRQATKSTDGGGTKMGETEYWDEFVDPDTYRPAGRIAFGESWDQAINIKHELAKSYGNLVVVGQKSKLNQPLDLKNDKTYAQFGFMTGKLLDGKYVSARSAGNYLAGYNGREIKMFGGYAGNISFDTYMRLAGALQQGQYTKWNAAMILLFKTEYGPAPWFGEMEYTGRMVKAGWQTSRK